MDYRLSRLETNPKTIGTGRTDNYANSMDMAAVCEAEKAESKNVIEESKNNPKPTNWPLPPPPREDGIYLVFNMMNRFRRREAFT